jgi:GDP-L-fucose synthase
MFKNKKILIIGGSGMIGRQLVSLLLSENAEVHVADLNKPINMSKEIIFHNIDLKNFDNCKDACKNMDYVFNLVGIKCSPQVCIKLKHRSHNICWSINTNLR